MKLKMRIISVFLCIAMVMTTLPVSSLTVKAVEGDSSVSDNTIIEDGLQNEASDDSIIDVLDDEEDEVMVDGAKAIIVEKDEYLAYSGHDIYIRMELQNVEAYNLEYSIQGNNSNKTEVYGSHDDSGQICVVRIGDSENSKLINVKIYDSTDPSVYKDITIKNNEGLYCRDIHFSESEGSYLKKGESHYIQFNSNYVGASYFVYGVVASLTGNMSSGTKVENRTIYVAEDETAEYVDVTLHPVTDDNVYVTKRYYIVDDTTIDTIDIEWDSWFKLSPVYSYYSFYNILAGDSEYKDPVRIATPGLKEINYWYYECYENIYYYDEDVNDYIPIEADIIYDNIDIDRKYAVRYVFNDTWGMLDSDLNVKVKLNGTEIATEVIKLDDYNDYYYVMLPVDVYIGSYIGYMTLYLSDLVAMPGDSICVDCYLNDIYGEVESEEIIYSITGANSEKTIVDKEKMFLHIGKDETADYIDIQASPKVMPGLITSKRVWISHREPEVFRFDIFTDVPANNIIYRGELYYINCTVETTASQRIGCDIEFSGNNEDNSDYLLQLYDGYLYFEVGRNNKATKARVTVYPAIDKSKGVTYELDILDKKIVDYSEINISMNESKLMVGPDTTAKEYVDAVYNSGLGNLKPLRNVEDFSQKYYIDGNSYYGEGVRVVRFDEDGEYSFVNMDDTFEVGASYGLEICINAVGKNGYVFDNTKEFKDVHIKFNGEERLDIKASGFLDVYNEVCKAVQVVVPIKDINMHEHSGILVPGKPATCQNSGWKDYYQCICGNYYEDEQCQERIYDIELWKNSEGYMSQLSHDFSGEYKADPTGHWFECTLCGERSLVYSHYPDKVATDEDDSICSECGYMIQPNLKHVHEGEVLVPGVDATCTESGVLESYICNYCKHVFKDKDCTNEIIDTYTWSKVDSIIPAKGHKGGKATCSKKAVCEVCNKEYGELLPHTPVEMPAVEPTCTEKGKGVGSKCSVCGAILQQQPDIAAKGHIWDAGKVTKESTLTEEGEKLFTCTVCKETKTEKIDKLPAPPKKDIEIPAKGKIDAAELLKDKIGNEKISRYVSSDKTIATVNKKGLVTGKKDGTVTITAQKKERKKYYDVASVTITIRVPVLTKKVSIKYLDEKKDMMKELSNVPDNQPIVWSIPESKKAIADIDAKGVIIPKKNGKVKVTCTIGEGKAAVKYVSTVTVKAPLLSIKDNVVLKNGKTKAVALKNVDKNANVMWSVSDGSALEIVSGNNTPKIKIKANKPGTVELKAVIEGREFKSKVTIQ